MAVTMATRVATVAPRTTSASAKGHASARMPALKKVRNCCIWGNHEMRRDKTAATLVPIRL
eukprot:4963431-Pyramimonas_sp.AAC.2